MKSLLLFLPTAPSTPPSHLHFKSTFTSSSLTFPFKNDLKYIHFLPFTFFLPRSFYSNASSSTSNLNTTATTGNKLLTIIEQLNNQPNKWVSLQHLIQTGSLAWSFSSKKNHPPLSSTAFISTLPSTTPPFMHATQNTPPSFSSSTSTATTFTNPLSLSQLLINNAHFLRSELPRRLAKRCKAFQMLPYIVGTNPYIHHVFSLYMQSLQTLLQLPTIESEKEEEHFDVALDQLVKAHLHVIPTLAQGFLESSKYISVSLVNAFLDELIHARIGVRVLAEHHLALHHPQPNFVGIIDFALHPATSILSIYHQLHDTAKFHFGDVPTLELVGHTDFTFAYIPVHFNYILTEVLKNSIRATMEEHRRRSSSFLVTSTPPPPIQVTLVNSENEVVMCIRDQGGGIPPHQVEHVFDYAYSTASSQNHPSIMNEDRLHPDYSSSPFDVFAGQGYGLGTSRVYTRFFGGSLSLVSMYGHGCDVFVRLKKLDAKGIDIKI